MKSEVLQFVDFNSDVVENAYATDTFNQFLFFESVRRASHRMDFHSSVHRPHQPLDDNRILIALVLDEQGVLRAIDELGDAFATIVVAPNETRMLSHVEHFPVPVGLEA